MYTDLVIYVFASPPHLKSNETLWSLVGISIIVGILVLILILGIIFSSIFFPPESADADDHLS